MDPIDLPLRDIALPPPVPWWPPAPGWWVAAALLLAALVATAWYWRGRHGRHLRRAALAVLASAEAAYARDGDGHRYAGALSALARQVALRLRGEPVAALTGELWCNCLEALAGEPLPPAARVVFNEAAYSGRAAARLASEDYRAVAEHLRRWLAHLPLRPGNAGRV